MASRFRAALADNVISRNYTPRLFMASILLTLSSANFAFDNQGFSQTQAMDPFIRRFGDQLPNGTYVLPPTFLSYSNAFPFLLLVCGIIIGSMISSRFGRRTTVFIMSIWAICMVPIVVTSSNRNQFLAGRCLNSVYIGMEMSSIPVFQAELVPPQVRGLAVASYQMAFAFGGFVISGICHRTAEIPNDWSWRIPFLCYLFVPSVVASFIWFQPESPRWLVSHNRIPEARRALTIIRKSHVDIEHELSQIMLALETERKVASSGSYAACFRPKNLRRTLIVIAVNFFLQATGQAFTSLYGAVIIKQLGTINPFNYTLINNGLNAFVYLLNIFLNDLLGRRPLMLLSAATQAVCMYIIAGLGTIPNPSYAVNTALVTFIILFSNAFCFGWAPLSYLVSAETPSQTLRDKTTRMGFAVGIIMQFVVAFCLPYLLYAPYADLGMKVGFIFAPIATLAVVWAWFFLQECKGLTLEQIDLLFETKVPAWRSAAWGREHLRTPVAADKLGNIVLASDEHADDHERTIRGSEDYREGQTVNEAGKGVETGGKV